jgi:Fic family protein
LIGRQDARERLAPGAFRRVQVWVGGTRPGNAVFVPAPADALGGCLDAFERFLHDDPEPTPPLVKAALAHVQLETIHPFLDGNGRVGRLLVALQLAADGLLREPMLCVSLVFKQRRATYYELLDRVRRDGDWEAWLEFFAEAVRDGANEAASAARRLFALAEEDGLRLERLGRAAPSARAVHRVLQRRPIANAGSLVAETGLTAATVNRALAHLERAGVVAELTQRRRGRLFAYTRYVAILNEGLERVRSGGTSSTSRDPAPDPA